MLYLVITSTGWKMAEDDEKKIKLTVKTPKDKVELLVSPDSTVKEVS